MMEKAGGIDGSVPGEALERGRRRRKFRIIAILFAVGFVGGFAAGFTQSDDLFDPARKWPPALAAALAGLYLVAAIWGGILYARSLDEFDRVANYKAVSAAATSYVAVYPVWLLLWKGGLLPEPMHVILFLIFAFTMAVASFFYRVR